MVSNIKIICADIFSKSADAIVCPAHKHLIRGRGISAQIFDRAGAPLVDECARLEKCGIGECRLTGANNLPYRHIIHTVTPQWSSGDQWGVEAIIQLRYCYTNILELALKNDIRSLVFPALGAGTNRFPHSIAAHQCLAILKDFAARFDQLTVCLRSIDNLRDWLDAANKVCPDLLCATE